MESQGVDFAVLFGWALCAAATALTLTLGAILSYHWYRYAFNRAVASLAIVTYFGVSALLLLTLFATALI